jgi:CubicO group peptidase (beta-lactamase class C family)
MLTTTGRSLPAAAILGCLGLLLPPGAAAASSDTWPSATRERIQRIEQGLLPAVLVEGEPLPTVPLSQRMSELHVPGVSIAVVHGGRIDWAGGFGVARLGGPPVTSRTLFQAASISKPITALAVLHLVDAGRLDLDADVNQYLRTWQVPGNSLTRRRPVTLRELLTHTAGTTVSGFPGYVDGAALPTSPQILDGLPPANTEAIRVDAEPGTLQRYSGGGYVVARQLLTDVTGMPFQALMQQMVLRPIGMTRSTFAQPLPGSWRGSAATPYTGTGEPVPGGARVYPELAPDGLWTTPSDLARYIIEVQRSLRGLSNRVLSQSMARAMLMRQPGEPNRQGLGPALGGEPQHPYFLHGGTNEGFRCRFVAYTTGEGAVIMTNGQNGGQLIDEILRAIAREYQWPDLQPPVRAIAQVDPARFAGYVGVYRLNEAQTLTVTLESGQLYSQITDQPRRALYPTSAAEFFLREMDERISFTTDTTGRAISLTQYHFGVQDLSPRVAGP